MHIEIRYFLIYENILRTIKNFRNHRNFFQVLLNTIFCKSTGTFNQTFLILSLLAYNTFSAGFCFLINLKFNLDFISCFSLTVKKQKFKNIQVHGWTPFSMLTFSKCLVFFCLFTPFLSVLSVFHGRNLVLLHLMNRYATSTSE